jgi:hypothetical protein
MCLPTDDDSDDKIDGFSAEPWLSKPVIVISASVIALCFGGGVIGRKLLSCCLPSSTGEFRSAGIRAFLRRGDLVEWDGEASDCLLGVLVLSSSPVSFMFFLILFNLGYPTFEEQGSRDFVVVKFASLLCLLLSWLKRSLDLAA